MSTLTKQDLINAAANIVEEKAQAALDADAPSWRDGYTEAITVAGYLQEQRVLTHPDEDSTHRERARRSIEAKTKRLLDEAATAGRLVRLSSRDHKMIPCLDGQRRAPYGPTVYYTTQALYERAALACENADARRRQDRDEFTDLLTRYARTGLPTPAREGATTITFDLDTFRALVDRLES